MNGAAAELRAVLEGSFAQRVAPGRALVDRAAAVARACHAIAARFRAGGRLLAFGEGLTAADAEHIAVEFLHPVIVGKRALPAVALAGQDPFADSLSLVGTPRDIALGLSLDGRCGRVAGALEAARSAGMLTVALTGGAAESPVARAAAHAIVIDAGHVLAVRETLVTAYHVLWELVHVFLERPASTAAAAAMARADEPCVTCADVATPRRVVALLEGGMARVDAAGIAEDVAVDLVDARVGDIVLVHGGVAIGILS